MELLPPDSPMLGEVLHFYGLALFNSLGDYARAVDVLRRSYEIGVRNRDARLQAINLTAGAFVDNRTWRLEEARLKLDRAAPLLEKVTDPYSVTHYLILRGQALLDQGRLDDSIPFADRWIEIASNSRDAFAIGASHFTRSASTS